MLNIAVTAETSASAEQVLALAGTDFSARRAEIWPNVTTRRLEVHRQEVADQQAEQRLALQWCDGAACLRPLRQRLASLVGERVDGALARPAGLLAGRQVAELREALGLGVVLALSRPGEHPSALGHLQEVVGAGSLTADQAEDLAGGQAEFCTGHVSEQLPRASRRD